mgnify:CR=1 FL=1
MLPRPRPPYTCAPSTTAPHDASYECQPHPCVAAALQVLRDFQEDPRGAQKHLKSPEIMVKINKLVAAGIIQVK